MKEREKRAKADAAPPPPPAGKKAAEPVAPDEERLTPSVSLEMIEGE